MSACPGHETSPNLCTCPCYGCKHHCAFHRPVVLSDLTSKREDTVWTWVTNAWLLSWALALGLFLQHVVGKTSWQEALLIGIPAGLIALPSGLLFLVVPIHIRKRQLLRRRS